MADVDPALGQQILDVAQRQRVSHVHHHDQTDDLWRAVEISERIAHAPRLTQPGPLKICSDTAGSAGTEAHGDLVCPPPQFSTCSHPACRLLYIRFTRSYRDVEDLLAERGLDVSYETVRRWVSKFGGTDFQKLRRIALILRKKQRNPTPNFIERESEPNADSRRSSFRMRLERGKDHDAYMSTRRRVAQTYRRRSNARIAVEGPHRALNVRIKAGEA